jgi:CRISPR type I-E-associated protein CasB/Cse2
MTNLQQEEKRPSPGLIALRWWDSLRPQSKQGGRKGGNPGALARLRRANLAGAAMEEVTIDLFKRLAGVSKLPRDVLFERAALIAAVLAHVREEDDRKVVAAAAGEQIGDDQRRVHPLRLRRLLAAQSDADSLIAFRRLVALLGKRVNVADLAESLLDWPDAVRGDKRRRRWAFDYYGAGSAAPEDNDQVAA